MSPERLSALKILEKIRLDSTPLQVLLASEPPFVKELVYGVCRYYFRLEAIAGLMLPKRPKEEAIGWVILMGLYQLWMLELPEYAVVKESVDAIAHLKKTWAKGLVNAVLRRFCREKESLLKQAADTAAFKNNHPLWFVQALKTDWPEDWQTILEHNDKRPPMSLRVNQQKISREEYLLKLANANIEAQTLSLSANGVVLTKPIDVKVLPGFLEGEVSVQDEAAQLAIEWLELAPHLRVLDACAAPGGKTCHILEQEPALKECVALDIDERRLKKISDNTKRLELSATLIQGDASRPETWWDGQLFERILLDAPCSALGVIRRHPDIKLLRTPEDVQEIIKTQALLLDKLWPLLRPGGRLVYATCSVMKQEGELQISQFLANHSDAESWLPSSLEYGHGSGIGRQILPGEKDMDGFYYAALIKEVSHQRDV